MYNTIEDLLKLHRCTGESLHRIILKEEMELSELSEEQGL